jgi:hypothetical protein
LGPENVTVVGRSRSSAEQPHRHDVGGGEAGTVAGLLARDEQLVSDRHLDLLALHAERPRGLVDVDQLGGGLGLGPVAVARGDDRGDEQQADALRDGAEPVRGRRLRVVIAQTASS